MGVQPEELPIAFESGPVGVPGWGAVFSFRNIIYVADGPQLKVAEGVYS